LGKVLSLRSIKERERIGGRKSGFEKEKAKGAISVRTSAEDTGALTVRATYDTRT